MQFLSPKTKRHYASQFKKAILLFAFVILFLILFFAHRSFLVVRSLECRYGQNDCPEPIITIISHYQGRSILRLNQNQIKKDVLATGWGQNSTLTFTLSGRLRLYLEPVSLAFPIVGYWGGTLPSLSLDSATNSAELLAPALEIKIFLASQSGQRFQITSTGLLIKSESDSPIAIVGKNRFDDDQLSKVFLWIKELSYQEIKFKSLFFLENIVIVEALSPPDIIFNLLDNPGKQIAALQEIKKAATIKDTKVIDFRYTNPILR